MYLTRKIAATTPTQLRDHKNSTPSRSNFNLQKESKRLHPSNSQHKNFIFFSKQVSPHLAKKYLTILEQIFKYYDAVPTSSSPLTSTLFASLLVDFSTGETILPWTRLTYQWRIVKNVSMQNKIMQLAFLRRFPIYFENDKINHQVRIMALEVPVHEGLIILETALEPSILALDTIQKGYVSKYVGHDKIVTPILHTISDYATKWQKDTYLAPYTSLIGPTMIGKTRLLMQLAEEVCVVYICLRPLNSTGEPKRSELASEMLVKSKLGADTTDYYVRLIAAILSVTVVFFQSTSKEKDRREVLLEWYKHHTSTNTDFYSSVQSDLKSKMNPKRTPISQLGHVVNEVGKTHILHSTPLKVLFAIDEARTLLDKPNSLDPSLFYLFRRALRTVKDSSGIFTLLVDTTSRVSNFNPRAIDDPSSRALGLRGNPIKMFPPIYELRTFDRMVPSNPPQQWDELFSPERLCKYGIPFFSLYLQAEVEDDVVENTGTIIHSMARFALRKLLCSDMAGSPAMTDARALALLGPTIGVPLYGRAHLNVELTSSHAAHSGYINSESGHQHSFYPSQPIYAVAANHYLHQSDKTLVSCINSLTTIVSKGDVTTGDAGELASRIILLCAMSKTVADMKKAPKSKTNPSVVEQITFPDPIPVTKFLETLTGLPANELPLGAIDADHKQKLFQHGMMFWNHFRYCSHRPTTESLLKCMYRGLALQCRPNQEAFDQVLPIYLKDKSEPNLHEANMTFCGIQVKNRKDDSQVRDSQDDMKPEKAKISMMEEDNPYLALYFTFQKPPPRKPNEVTGSQNKYELPCGQIPDCRQASLVFYGLESFHFLSPTVKEALEKLINVRRDIISLHGKNELGRDFAQELLLDDDYMV
ncbi:hypothetical protein PCASD_00361 [Puccinia coronata f. sp. avenae]|uniref:Uncharacterized protein n=1 Tax=Puccinia coronata f. sp. avenae TaxID=200324 RepID=A0A2N5VN73_9BASI|nr:hypothetical protein PCASD_00361 [Puccinia coronata f. sp. avenae]